MSSTPSNERILERIADEFLERRQQGEFPSIESFCQQYPDLANEIPKFLRTIELMGLSAASVSDSPVHDTSPVKPASIGGYRIVEEIGRGGMGVVYAAEQESLNRRVALKVVPRRWIKESSATERFKREAQVTAKLHHTNIVPVYEVGEEGNYLFYAMQLIEGRSLHELIEETQLGEGDSETGTDGVLPSAHAEPLGDLANTLSSTNVVAATSATYRLKRYRSAASIILQAADALTYAHKRKIIHRDIKPSNLLLDGSGVVWLTDFGVAKFDDNDLTSTGDLLGTLRYMAPERFRGECDERADVYALGLTLYELLSLRPAYSNSDRLELVNAIKTGMPPSLKSIDRRIPRDLETIVLRAIEPEPNRRYASAKALAQDLRRFLDDRAIAARRSTPLEQLIRFCRRNKQLAAAFTTILALMCLMTLGALYAALHFRSGEKKQKLLTQRAQSAESSLQQNLYRTQMFSASTSLGSQGGIAQVQRLTDASHPDQLGVDLRGWEWFYLRALCNQRVQTADSQAEFVWSVDWHSGGEFVATGDNNGDVKIWHALHLKETKRFNFNGQVYSVRWSPGGEFLGIAHGNDISIVDFTDGKVVRHWQRAHKSQVSRVIWSPSGRQVASSSEDGTIKLWDLDGNKQGLRLVTSKNGIQALAWSPDGRRIASGDGPGRLRLWDVATHRLLWESFSHSSIIRDLSFHPSGRKLASASVDRTISVHDVADGQQTHTIMVPTPVHALTWNSDGDRLISGNWDGTVRVYDVEAEQEVKTLYGHNDRIRDIATSPDGLRLATVAVGGGIKFFDLSLPDDNLSFPDGISSGRNCASWSVDGMLAFSAENDLVVCDTLKNCSRRLVGHEMQISCIRWSPNGKLIATSAYKEPARIWDAETGATLHVLDAGAIDTFSVAWSPNGEFVAIAHDDVTVFWDVATGKEVKRITGNNILLTSIDWHPDNDQIALAGLDSTIHIYSTKTLDRISSLTGHLRGIECVRWSPDGKSLASSGYDHTVRIWDPIAETERHVLRGHERIVRSLAWHPSGNRIASVGGDAMLRIWDTRAGAEVVALAGHTLFVRAVDWSTDGRKILTTSWDGSVRIWDASRGHDYKQ